jgi:hypothetical protein
LIPAAAPPRASQRARVRHGTTDLRTATTAPPSPCGGQSRIDISGHRGDRRDDGNLVRIPLSATHPHARSTASEPGSFGGFTSGRFGPDGPHGQAWPARLARPSAAVHLTAPDGPAPAGSCAGPKEKSRGRAGLHRPAEKSLPIQDLTYFPGSAASTVKPPLFYPPRRPVRCPRSRSTARVPRPATSVAGVGTRPPLPTQHI